MELDTLGERPCETGGDDELGPWSLPEPLPERLDRARRTDARGQHLELRGRSVFDAILAGQSFRTGGSADEDQMTPPRARRRKAQDESVAAVTTALAAASARSRMTTAMVRLKANTPA